MNNAVPQSIRLVIGSVLVVGLSGCQTVQGMVCHDNRSRRRAPRSCPADASDPGALAESRQVTHRGIDQARNRVDNREGSLRTLSRRPKKNPLEVASPTVKDTRVDTSDSAVVEQLRHTYGVDLSKAADAVAFQGSFAAKQGDELVVVRPERSLEVYGTDGLIATLDVGGHAAPKAFAKLGVSTEKKRTRAVRLVRGGSLQILTHWREKTEDDTFAYKVGLFKVIGPFIGHLFERTLAVSKTKDDQLTRRGTYEVLEGESNRFIRWIPADSSGQLLTDQAVILKWNHWEGVFRKPTTPPTAPKPKPKLQSYLTTPVRPTIWAQRTWSRRAIRPHARFSLHFSRDPPRGKTDRPR